MRVLSINEKPFYEIDYESISTTKRIVPSILPILRGYVDSLPNSVDGIILTSDLQGREPKWHVTGDTRLLGELLVEELELLAGVEEIPPLDRLGVILAGDFFARFGLDRRGGSGDVRDIWRAFATRFHWVVGVAGNHDVFSEKPSLPAFQAFIKEDGINFLDGTSVKLDGQKFAGISGVIGNPRKPFRWERNLYIRTLEKLIKEKPDMLILHDGPDYPNLDLQGDPDIREVIEKTICSLIVRGHKNWNIPLVEYSNGNQVLNVDSRVVLLVRD